MKIEVRRDLRKKSEQLGLRVSDIRTFIETYGTQHCICALAELAQKYEVVRPIHWREELMYILRQKVETEHQSLNVDEAESEKYIPDEQHIMTQIDWLLELGEITEEERRLAKVVWASD